MAAYRDNLGPVRPPNRDVIYSTSTGAFHYLPKELEELDDEELIKICEEYCLREWGLEMVKFQRISLRMFIAALRGRNVRFSRERLTR